jgi:hypothetical protein
MKLSWPNLTYYPNICPNLTADLWAKFWFWNIPDMTQECYWLATMFSYLPPVLWGFELDFSICKQVSGNDFMYSCISIYSSLSDAISNLNYKYTVDHFSHIWYTVSMGNWLLTFQGNTDVSSSVVDLGILTTTEDETTTLNTWLWKPENPHEYATLNACMEFWRLWIRAS